MRPLEIAAGMPLRRRTGTLRLTPVAIEPSAALERAVLPALLRPPCVVSFSGGRDSSLVLAAAVAVARSEGLAAPIPITVRFAASAESDEQEWQERVVRHFGLDAWVRLDIGDDFDCVGPVAQRVLLRHGVLWPPNAHFHIPQLERAAGGSLVTGVGGDEIFSPSGWARLRSVASGQAVPEPRDALRLGAALAPRVVRRRIVVARSELDLGWLHPEARREVLVSLADEAAAEPLTWRRHLEWLLGLGYVQLGTESLALLGRDQDVAVSHPLLDPGFVGSIAALPRRRRFSDRTAGLLALFSGLLPPEILSRPAKAVFTDALWGLQSRALAESWDGTGVDAELVDADALRKRWSDEGVTGPHTLLQSIWLRHAESAREGLDQPIERPG